MIKELSSRIWSNARFHTDAEDLRGFLLKFRYTNEIQEKFNEETLKKLLRSAAILSSSSERLHREMAYQIVTSASELESKYYSGIPYILLLVLSRIGNFPALSYAKHKYSVDEGSLPLRIYAESHERRLANSIILGESTVSLTDFQYQLWNELNTGEALGISAPTSAGKSFILQAYARKLMTDGRAGNIVFLVPTRALINQVSFEVSEWLRVSNLEVELITTPVPKDSSLPGRGVYVVTQERMQLLLAAHPALSFDVMLVDEVQSISDGARGVLLSSVIEEALLRRGTAQLVFAGPNIRNPGNIVSLFGRNPRNVRTDESSVVQNIIFVDCDEARPKSATLELLSNGKRIHLGRIECDQPLSDHRSKLVNIALKLGSRGQNLIYAFGPFECESIAFGLADNEYQTGSDELKELSEFVKDAVHPKYQLASNVLQGIGFHYGRLPSVVRKAIEDSFSTGQLKYLVTTSTLLYGVNLPAQNLFLHNPQKGQNQPISSIDFWNLAGRAGRLGKEFTGNIFLIDYGDWPQNPIDGEKDQVVRPSIVEHVVDKVNDLVNYINNPAIVPDRKKQDEFENTFVKLVRDYIDGHLDNTLDKVGLSKENPGRTNLVEAVKGSIVGSKIGRETLIAAPTVSIHRQQSLYERLDSSLKKKGPNYVIPKHPLDSKAYGSYFAAIKRCHDEILKFPKDDNSPSYFASIAIRWMQGDPLPKIIDESFKYKQKKGLNPNIASVIRETLNEVERELRFKYVRLFSCYNAVLELVLRNNNMSELTASIPSIPMYLEVGACSPTMISFMGLGLSRYTAGKLRELPRRSDMSQSEARSWIRRQNLDSLNLPNASIKEIRSMVLEG